MNWGSFKKKVRAPLESNSTPPVSKSDLHPWFFPRGHEYNKCYYACKKSLQREILSTKVALTLAIVDS